MSPLQHKHVIHTHTRTCQPRSLKPTLSNLLVALSQTCPDVKCYVRILELVGFPSTMRDARKSRRKNVVQIVKSNMWHEGAEQLEASHVDLPQNSLIWNRQCPVITDLACKICAAVKSPCKCVYVCLQVCLCESCLILFTSETRLPLL